MSALLVAIIAAGGTAYQAYIARDAETRSLRAYVSLSLEFKKIQGFNSGETPYIYATFDNLGQTPVYKATWISGINALPYPLNTTFTYPDCKTLMQENDTKQWSFGKSATIDKTGPKPISNEEWNGYLAGSIGFYFHGRVCYRDIFDTVRRTDFCTVYSKVSNGVFALCDRSNDAK
jgi:hypothetical protein